MNTDAHDRDRHIWPLGPVALIVLAVVMAAGCGGDGVVEPRELPDIGGTWQFFFLAHPNGAMGNDGQCEFGPIALDLTQFDAGLPLDSVTGTHASGTLVCAEVTSPATGFSGYSDTVIQVDAGLVIGLVAWFCNAPVPPYLPCPASVPLYPWVALRFAGQEFTGPIFEDPGGSMGGGFDWVDTVLYGGPSAVLLGTWRAVR